jgi:hypothetical protein
MTKLMGGSIECFGIQITKQAPASTNAVAIALPIPDAAPVTTAPLLFNIFMVDSP